ncbi:hypothetical protein BDW02DRAFT_568833 [Decorospora gaudefroyi]|uniref:Uncharacterized protein n=1 Tax=Decorospora gaudefroyi TaxID=184978 RepID=A0A6A5KFQ0_9PLEO|nr:hypothetical protein BDW02DRAFT_568833 [Decorospora gaudefroyi]
MAPTLLSLALASVILSPLAHSAAVKPRAPYDFGSCGVPQISYVKGEDGLNGYGFKPTNQKDFPHGAAPDFVAIAQFICNRLKNECVASGETVALCRLTLLASKKETDDAAKASVFNKWIKSDKDEEPSPKPKPKKPTKPEYNIETKISSKHVIYEGDLDLRWWFDNKMITDDPSNGASCPVDWFNMGNNKAIKFECSFPDGSVEKLLREAMNTLIQESVTSTKIKEGEKPFARYDAVPGACNRWGVCPEEKPFTKFPAVGDMKLFNLTGERNEEQGNLHYEISEVGGDACKVCDYLGAAGAGADGLASVVGGKLASASFGGAVGAFTGVVTIGCFLAGC